MTNSNKNFLIITIICLILVITVVVGYIYYQNNKLSSKNTSFDSSKTGISLLYSNDGNVNFKKAQLALNNGKLSDAAGLLESSLTEVADTESEAHIKYLLARTYEDLDTIKAIKLYKEVIADPNYPDNQKTFAVMRLPIILNKYGNDDIKAEILTGQPYASFASDNLAEVYKNLYEYSVSFGTNGMGEFYLARFNANKLAKLKESSPGADYTSESKVIENYLIAGKNFISENLNVSNNKDMIPMILREKARANGAFAVTGDPESIEKYDQYFEEAITAGLSQHIDGAVRFDYFLYGYLINGDSSFAKTQPHLDILVANINDYPGMKKMFAGEKNDFYGSKALFVKLANANQTFKDLLINVAGWENSDFAI